MDGGISDSWSQVLRWCVGGGGSDHRTVSKRKVLMKVHHQSENVMKNSKTQSWVPKSCWVFFLFQLFGDQVSLISWKLGVWKGEKGFSIGSITPYMRWKQSETTSFAICLVWLSVVLSFFHAPQILWRGPWSTWCAARNVLAPCYVASSARHYAHVQPSALDHLRAKTVTRGLWRELEPVVHRFLHQQSYSRKNLSYNLHLLDQNRAWKIHLLEYHRCSERVWEQVARQVSQVPFRRTGPIGQISSWRNWSKLMLTWCSCKRWPNFLRKHPTWC